ncbi:uncharacterized protein LOC105696273 [Orussus abietinus]|uniref:uncharacterized protein LOC105696273 n=1 Tax=Orussus abietinus TaxID=222816 RepID=UPI0006269BD0|nr:uncharacterized protein LOC105696273 [Orussus abietinus]
MRNKETILRPLKIEKKPATSLTRRISATKNFVYEMGPIENSVRSKKIVENSTVHLDESYNTANCKKCSLSSTQKRVKNILTFSLISTFSGISGKRSGNKKCTLGKNARKHVARFPKLKAGYSSDDSLKRNIDDVTTKTTLPLVRRGNSILEGKTASRHINTKVPRIEEEVDNVKTNWQKLREKHWAHRKDYLEEDQKRKLYKTLENMTSQLDKMQIFQRPCQDEEHSHKNVVKALNKPPKTSFVDEVSSFKNSLFPKKHSSSKKPSLTSILENCKKEKLAESVLGNFEKKNPSKRDSSIAKSSAAQKRLSFGQSEKINGTSRKNIAENDSKRQEVKSELEEYLEKYGNFEKAKKGEPILETSPRVVEDILGRLNIRDCGFFDFVDDDSKSTTLGDATCNFLGKGILPEEIKIRSDEGVNRKITNATTSLSKGTRKILLDANCVDASSQGNSYARKPENVFVRMGLNGIEEHVPQHLVPQILKSEYLSKNLASL